MATPNRKRKTSSLLGDEDEPKRVYNSANLVSQENPFASPAKKTAVSTSSAKCDPAAPCFRALTRP